MSILSSALAGALLASQHIYGIAVAGDGDSLFVNGVSVRLFGIDAPEYDQQCTRGGTSWPCGKAASDHLSQLATGREVRCVLNGTDTYGRALARCSTTKGIDINQTMVTSGHAVAFRKYSMDYASAEDAARNAKRGLWSGTFKMPSEVRDEGRKAVPPRQSGNRTRPTQTRPVRFSGGCVIKGNHSPRGEYIYHLPGMPYYSRTKAEAMFCSEGQAQAAGFRRARVR